MNGICSNNRNEFQMKISETKFLLLEIALFVVVVVVVDLLFVCSIECSWKCFVKLHEMSEFSLTHMIIIIAMAVIFFYSQASVDTQ